MTTKTQQADNKRFELLSRLRRAIPAVDRKSARPDATEEAEVMEPVQDPVELIRDFEISLFELWQEQQAPKEYKHADVRAQKLSEADFKIAVINKSIPELTPATVNTFAESLSRAVAERDEVLKMPEHVYECLLCEPEDEHFKTFQSAARRILVVVADVDHDDEGHPVNSQRFNTPQILVLCPGCKGKVRLAEYIRRWGK